LPAAEDEAYGEPDAKPDDAAHIALNSRYRLVFYTAQSMWCAISPLRHRGISLPAYETDESVGCRGHLRIREEVDESRRRSMLVARVWAETVFGTKGSTRLAAREVHRPLFDVHLLYFERDLLVLAGLDRSSSGPVVEYAQTWRIKLLQAATAMAPKSMSRGGPEAASNPAAPTT